MPRALLIDLDGVLRRWPATDDVIAGIPRATIARIAFAREHLEPVITGRIDDATWRRRIVDALAHPDAAEAVARWSAPCGEVDRDVLAVVRVARRQAKIVLVTNATSRLPADLAALDLARELDHVVSSADVGTAKPDPAIYAAALAAAGVEAEDAVFVDDSEANVDGALRSGLASHLFRGVEGLASFLRERGLG